MSKKEYKILIVEDEDAVRENIVKYLRLTYTHIFQASNGYEGYQIYSEQDLDLIITDIEMPKMDGLTFIEKVRDEDSILPIIVVSAYSDKEKLLRAVKLQLVDYIMKPMTRQVLGSLMQKIRKQEENNVSENVHVVLGMGYTFDTVNQILYHESKQIFITKQESVLLALFVSQKNKLLSSVDIFFHLHNDFDVEYSNGLVRNLIFKLRKILPEGMIKTVYGGGYILNVEEN